MIKIISGYTGPGGSTTAFINLCNAFNQHGLDCIFYGPHSWHMDKCRSKDIEDFFIERGDSLIVHFLDSKSADHLEAKCRSWHLEGYKRKIARLASLPRQFMSRLKSPEIHSCIFSCHEKEVFPLCNKNYQHFEKIHYVSQQQQEWQAVHHPFFICPNILDDLTESKGDVHRVAGIVGSISLNKQVHTSIERAIKDNMNKILIYGEIDDKNYFKEKIQPFLDQYPNRIEVLGFCNDKQTMYDSVSDVYHSSISETWGYIKGECELTKTQFHGNSSTCGYQFMPKKEILKVWVRELGL